MVSEPSFLVRISLSSKSAFSGSQRISGTSRVFSTDLETLIPSICLGDRVSSAVRARDLSSASTTPILNLDLKSSHSCLTSALLSRRQTDWDFYEQTLSVWINLSTSAEPIFSLNLSVRLKTYLSPSLITTVIGSPKVSLGPL